MFEAAPIGPARDNPTAGPRTGTTRSEPSAPAAAGASGRHHEPGSRPASTCPVQPPSKTGRAQLPVGEGTSIMTSKCANRYSMPREPIRGHYTHTHAHTHTHARTHVENRKTRTEQRKAVGETFRELQSSPRRLLVCQSKHSAQCTALQAEASSPDLNESTEEFVSQVTCVMLTNSKLCVNTCAHPHTHNNDEKKTKKKTNQKDDHYHQ